MKPIQRIAALAGGTILALATLPIATTTAATAAPAACPKTESIYSWGKAVWTECTRVKHGATYKQVRGTVTDLKTDGCRVVAWFKVKRAEDTLLLRYYTGTSTSFVSGWEKSTKITDGMGRVDC
jgi:hypothetical protein